MGEVVTVTSTTERVGNNGATQTTCNTTNNNDIPTQERIVHK